MVDLASTWLSFLVREGLSSILWNPLAKRQSATDFIIQAIVNGRKIFIVFACGFPGSMHDARVLRRSTIFQKAEQGDILTQPTVNVHGNEIGRTS